MSKAFTDKSRASNRRQPRIVPSLLPLFEDRLTFDDVTQAAAAFWPLPVYRPRLRMSPESVAVDENGISLVMDVTAAAADPRKAPPTPRVERSAGIAIDTVPHDTELRLGLAPNVLAPLTQMLIDEGVARVNVLDIPDNKFAVFADRKALSEALPDLATIPDTMEINSELVLASPVQVRRCAGGFVQCHRRFKPRNVTKMGQPVSVTALKANICGLNARTRHRKPQRPDLRPVPGPFEFVVPKAVIEISIKDKLKAVHQVGAVRRSLNSI